MVDRVNYMIDFDDNLGDMWRGERYSRVKVDNKTIVDRT